MGLFSTIGDQVGADKPDQVSFKPGNVSGGLGDVNFDEFGNSSFNLSQDAQQFSDLFQQVGLDSIRESSQLDPNKIASQQFQKFRNVVEPQRQKDRANLQSGLFGQGILGLSGAGGANPFALAQEQAFADSDRNAAFASLGEGNNFINQLFNRGTTASSLFQNINSSLLPFSNVGLQVGQGRLAADTSNQSANLQRDLFNVGLVHDINKEIADGINPTSGFGGG